VLGYDVDPAGGRLIVNEEETERVRAIFTLFEENRSVLLTLAEIEPRGWRLKSWTRESGQFRSSGPFAINSLRRLLTNILYAGSIRHKGQPYPGRAHRNLGSRHVGPYSAPDHLSCSRYARQIAQ
jgi:site-specific DNA recombinase